MTGPADLERRQTRRRAEDRGRAQAGGGGGANLPAVIEPPAAARRQAKADAAFEAQLFGQAGQKRGLRAGQPAIDQARAAYLGTEFSGQDDRRPPKGLLRKAEI